MKINDGTDVVYACYLFQTDLVAAAAFSFFCLRNIVINILAARNQADDIKTAAQNYLHKAKIESTLIPETDTIIFHL